jgi:uncharacterized membrane protein
LLKNKFISVFIFLLRQGEKNSWVRFHAAQSIIVFGTITVAASILGLIPIIGTAFSAIIWIIGFVLWIILMVKAYNGARYKVVWAGDIAERMVNAPSGIPYEYTQPPKAPATAETPPAGLVHGIGTGVIEDRALLEPLKIETVQVGPPAGPAHLVGDFGLSVPIQDQVQNIFKTVIPLWQFISTMSSLV